MHFMLCGLLATSVKTDRTKGKEIDIAKNPALRTLEQLVTKCYTGRRSFGSLWTQFHKTRRIYRPPERLPPFSWSSQFVS